MPTEVELVTADQSFEVETDLMRVLVEEKSHC